MKDRVMASGESMTRVAGWGPFPLPGEARRRRDARDQAVADMLRARGSVDEHGNPVPVDWGDGPGSAFGTPTPPSSAEGAGSAIPDRAVQDTVVPHTAVAPQAGGSLTEVSAREPTAPTPEPVMPREADLTVETLPAAGPDSPPRAEARGSSGLFHWFLKWVAVGPTVRVIFRPKAEGVANVPRAGAAILASNHLSAADWIFMPLALRRKVTFLAKAEYFTGSGVRGWLQRTFFSGSGQVPVVRTSASPADDAVRTGVGVLRQGGLLGLYPEGTRSPDGRLYRGKTGVARLALETGAPVIPVGMIYRRQQLPFGREVTRVEVRFGQPLSLSLEPSAAGDPHAERLLTDEIMHGIAELSGQQYVDVDAAKFKKMTEDTGSVTPGMTQKPVSHSGEPLQGDVDESEVEEGLVSRALVVDLDEFRVKRRASADANAGPVARTL